MRICVFSDSHGYKENMVHVVSEEKPDLVLYLGDGEPDFYNLKRLYPNIEMRNVRGNCDLRSAAPELISEKIAGKMFFITHGHRSHVKDPALHELKETAMWYPYEANIILYGHTHRAYQEHAVCAEILNPGTIGFSTPTYGLITIDNGNVSTEIKQVSNPQEKLPADQVMI